MSRRLNDFTAHYRFFLRRFRGQIKEYEFYTNEVPVDNLGHGGVDIQQNEKVQCIIWNNKQTSLDQSNGAVVNGRGIKVLTLRNDLEGGIIKFENRYYKLHSSFGENGECDGREIYSYDGFESTIC